MDRRARSASESAAGARGGQVGHDQGAGGLLCAQFAGGAGGGAVGQDACWVSLALRFCEQGDGVQLHSNAVLQSH